MKRTELERAWPAAEPSPGFSERVLERVQRGAGLPGAELPGAGLPGAELPGAELPGAELPGAELPGAASSSAALPEAARRRPRRLAWLKEPRVRWLALPAAALVLGGALLLWPAGPARHGDVIAAEPRVVAIGERAVAEMSRGAHLQWSGAEVRQDSGAVTYRVLPGADFRVQTPHGSVTALGTVFRVVVADREEVRGDAMKKRWAIGGASVTLGVLVWVSVERGSVRLSNDTEELVLAAGQAGALGSEGIRRQSAAPGVPADAGEVSVANAERARLRQVADAVRRHAARRRAATQAGTEAAAKQPASGQERSEPTTPPVEFMLPGSRNAPAAPESTEALDRRDYLRRVMQEQYIPVARDCYQELLERKPTAAGKVVLEFAIVGDGDAGVVDRVDVRDDEDTIEDPEFLLCMTESMYAAVFEPPPPGAKETTVVYPVMLSPD